MKFVLFAAMLSSTSAWAAPLDCDSPRKPELVAVCQAKSGAIETCTPLGDHDWRLLCFAVARKSVSACRQMIKADLQATCFEELGLTPEGEPVEKKSQGEEVPVNEATGQDCNKYAGDAALVCRARKTNNLDYCARVVHHDAKLYCYGVMQRSLGACKQIMDPRLEAECKASLSR